MRPVDWGAVSIPNSCVSVHMQRIVRAILTRLRSPQGRNAVPPFQACAQSALPCCPKQRTRTHFRLHTCMSLVYTSRLALFLSQPIQPISIHFHSSHTQSTHPPTISPCLAITFDRWIDIASFARIRVAHRIEVIRATNRWMNGRHGTRKPTTDLAIPAITFICEAVFVEP